MDNPTEPKMPTLCANCKTELVENAKFCHECGSMVDGTGPRFCFLSFERFYPS